MNLVSAAAVLFSDEVVFVNLIDTKPLATTVGGFSFARTALPFKLNILALCFLNWTSLASFMHELAICSANLGKSSGKLNSITLINKEKQIKNRSFKF